ncbi:MAG: hypothetical protein HZC37_13540 [Burkholderiales bacterium]|nr:hypothetical protein [Burkholderiales bacterium]
MATSQLELPSEAYEASTRFLPVLMPVGQLDERLCIAVVGASPSHGFWARSVVAKPLTCLPGELGVALPSFGSLVAADFVEWCTKGRPPESWQPPLAGLSTGDWMDASGFDFDDALRVCLSLCSLSAVDSIGEGKARPPSLAPRTGDEGRFLDSVMSEIGRTRPNLSRCFKKTLSLTGKGAAGELDFVGSHYVTCYAAVNPRGRISSRVQTASAALWRLARARDAFGFAAPAAIELTAWVPPSDMPIFTANDYRIVDETVAELTMQASKEQLAVFPVVDVGSACRRLIEKESERVTQ